MRTFVTTAAVAVSAAACAVLLPAAAANAATTPGVLTICAQGAHADVLVSPASAAATGPASYSIASGTCSSFGLPDGTYVVSLAQHGRTPAYGPSTVNDGGNFGFGEQPYDHNTTQYGALPGGGMATNNDDQSSTVRIVNPVVGGTPGQGAEVDFVFSDQMH